MPKMLMWDSRSRLSGRAKLGSASPEVLEPKGTFAVSPPYTALEI